MQGIPNCILGPLPVPGRRLPCPAIFSSYFGNKLRRAECSRRGEAYVWIPQRWRIPALNLRDCAEFDGYLSITAAGRGKVTFVHFRRIFVNFYRTFGLFVLAGCRRRHSVATISNLQQGTCIYRIALVGCCISKKILCKPLNALAVTYKIPITKNRMIGTERERPGPLTLSGEKRQS